MSPATLSEALTIVVAVAAAHRVSGPRARRQVSHSTGVRASRHEIRGGSPLTAQTSGFRQARAARAAATSQGGLWGLMTSTRLALASVIRARVGGASRR